MGRLFIPLVFFLLFFGWVLYRLLVVKDLRQQKTTLYFGFFFFGIWALLYQVLLTD